MTRRPSPRAVRLLASALGAVTLLTTAACVRDGDGDTGNTSQRRPAESAASPTSPASTAAQQTSTAPTALTDTQARDALLTPTDLGAPWAPTQGSALWRDALLKGTADKADCGRLLDSVYTEELLGEPSGAHAVVGFDDSAEGDQLHYQVNAAHRADVDKRLDWLRTMPKKCGRFTAVGTGGARQEVRVTEVRLPEAGDARQGLRLSTRGKLEGARATLTLDLAAVRVGDDAIVLTNGGLREPHTEYTVQAVQVGAERLKQTRNATQAPPQTPVSGESPSQSPTESPSPNPSTSPTPGQSPSPSPTRGPVRPQPQPSQPPQQEAEGDDWEQDSGQDEDLY
ncbi:hypothetical protein AB0945_07195 [Streptomyces sp. NPDC005474]|uniref:hypothetical protein n=1 Tax=Streptomyces sp. NPDC005474 TaxID=3154878 RepID=UPI0034539631